MAEERKKRINLNNPDQTNTMDTRVGDESKPIRRRDHRARRGRVNSEEEYVYDPNEARKQEGVTDVEVERELSEQEKLTESLIEQVKKTFLGQILYEQDENGEYIPGDYEINPQTLERKFIPDPESRNHKEVETITDVSFDGNYVYIQDNLVDRYRLNDPNKDPRIKKGLPPLNVRPEDVKQLGKDVANRMGMSWNPSAPIMDVEIGHLRSNFMDDSVSPYGVTMAIRVSRASLALRDISQSADEEVAALLEVFMKCGLNLLISGPTGTGN